MYALRAALVAVYVMPMPAPIVRVKSMSAFAEEIAIIFFSSPFNTRGRKALIVQTGPRTLVSNYVVGIMSTVGLALSSLQHTILCSLTSSS
jgi:hypothetical protein